MAALSNDPTNRLFDPTPGENKPHSCNGAADTQENGKADLNSDFFNLNAGNLNQSNHNGTHGPSSNSGSSVNTREKRRSIKEEVAWIRKQSTSDIYLLPCQRNGAKKYVTHEERREARRIHNAKGFAQFSDPFVIPGRTDVVIVGYSGLMTPNYSQRRLMVETSNRFGLWTEAYSLHGNDGKHEHLLRTTEEDMVGYLDTQIGRLQRNTHSKTRPKVIFFGYSTGALAGLVLEARKPGTFDAMILVGAPFTLRSTRDTFMLIGGDIIDRCLNRTSKLLIDCNHWLEKHTLGEGKVTSTIARFALRTCEALQESVVTMDDRFRRIMVRSPGPALSMHSKEHRRSPYLLENTVSNYLAFQRLRYLAASAVKEGKISCPIRATWGSLDELVESKSSKAFFDKHIKHSAAAEEVHGSDVETYLAKGSPHAVFLGPRARDFKERMWKFVSDSVVRLFPEEPPIDYSKPRFRMLAPRDRDTGRQSA